MHGSFIVTGFGNFPDAFEGLVASDRPCFLASPVNESFLVLHGRRVSLIFVALSRGASPQSHSYCSPEPPWLPSLT